MLGRMLNGLKGVSIEEVAGTAGFVSAGSVVTQGFDGSTSSLMDRATRTVRVTDADRARYDAREARAKKRG